jgi:uncharacterized protein
LPRAVAAILLAVSQENVEAVLRGYEAWNRRDFEATLELISEDVEWTFPEENLFPGIDRAYYGHAGVRRFWESFIEPWGAIDIEVEDLRDLGDRVAAFIVFHARGAASGVELHAPSVHVFTIRDRLVTRFEGYLDREAALEATGLRP